MSTEEKITIDERCKYFGMPILSPTQTVASYNH